MLNRRLIALLLLVLMYETCNAKDNHHCAPSSCGNIRDIKYPFRLEGDLQNCGHKNYELACQNNFTVLCLFSGKYYVHAINYNNLTIRVADPGVQKGNCSSLPRYYLSHYNFSVRDPYSWYKLKLTGKSEVSKSLIFMNCENPVKSPLFVDTAPCINSTNSSQRHSLVKIGSTNASDVGDLCRLELMVMTSMPGNEEKNISYMDIHDELVYGFELSWEPIKCACSGLSCFFNVYQYRCWHLFTFLGLSVEFLLWITVLQCAKCCFGTPCVLAFLIYKCGSRHLSMYDNVEEFFRSKNNFMTIRYSYSEIRRMTRGFKDELGEGGYGSVYKGKLPSGPLVAVKMLDKSKANGQEFINEVATLGRIYHVNVVQLIGYCFERSKRALVYDFMPNGSLDKYIFPQEGSTITLSCKKLYEISLGVARGIEYLHRGCDMKILHFDIKPHNILLDENFTPKISDFGLAKLHPVEDSIVFLTRARGTMGYIAPELFYNNVGGVSYKADVYSFGMLLMEMVGRRKNLNVNVEHLSQIYFPSWVYDQIFYGKDIDIGDIIEEEEKILAKKMIIVALWCIQLKPSDRPPMNKVVEMLEAQVESLQMPPKPFLSPQENSVEDVKTNTNRAGPSIISGDSTDSTISLNVISN